MAEPVDASGSTDPYGRAIGEVRAERSQRLLASGGFRRLWIASLVSSTGDWIALAAITSLAARVGGSSPAAAVALVLSARLLPGFFMAPIVGVLVDRWDRKRAMVACDIGRGLVLFTLPWVDTLAGLFFISLLLEVLTLMFGAAKEASVPNLVAPEHLSSANSLSLVAAYGTFPVGSAIFALLAKAAEWLGQYDLLATFEVNQASLAIYVDVATYFVSAVMVWTIPLRSRSVKDHDRPGAIHELREGWQYIRRSRIIRAVILGLATGLVGGGMLVPLGPVFAAFLGAGDAGFGLLLTALGTGVAGGIVLLSVAQRRLDHQRLFTACVVGAGVCIIAGASMSTLTPVLLFVALLGVCAGAVYVLGFTILHANVDDHIRGRIFAAFYAVIRLCLLLALTVAPALSELLDGLSGRLFDKRAAFGGWEVALPGVRLTLWLGGLIILAAGLGAGRSLRRHEPAPSS